MLICTYKATFSYQQQPSTFRCSGLFSLITWWIYPSEDTNIRCKACNTILEGADLRRRALDRDYCSDCRYHSNQKFTIHDKEYVHGCLTGILLDGTTLHVEEVDYTDDLEIFEDLT